jgi:hypothetical protein
MADPIEAHYTPDGDDWYVAVKGRGRTLTGRAPGLIAARDKADQLVEQLTTDESGRKTVVHLLNGDAVEFTTAYLTARLARTEDPTPTPEPKPPEKTTSEKVKDTPTPTPSPKPQAPKFKPTPAPRTESQAAHPAAKPPETTPAEETAPSGS